MEKTDIGYSLKYMGKAQKMRYLLQLTENMEMVIKRMNWRHHAMARWIQVT